MTLFDGLDPDRFATKSDLGELRKHMDERFAHIDQRLALNDDRYHRIERQLEVLSDRVWKGTLAFSAIMVTGFAAVFAGLMQLI